MKRGVIHAASYLPGFKIRRTEKQLTRVRFQFRFFERLILVGMGGSVGGERTRKDGAVSTLDNRYGEKNPLTFIAVNMFKMKSEYIRKRVSILIATKCTGFNCDVRKGDSYLLGTRGS